MKIFLTMFPIEYFQGMGGRKTFAREFTKNHIFFHMLQILSPWKNPVSSPGFGKKDIDIMGLEHF